MSEDKLLAAIKWDEAGLVPAIAQDWQTGEVLMVAWMNAAALVQTCARGEVVYFSRSRQQLWHKGESSGHVQKLKSLQLDCDGDVILARVEQLGGIACHTGRGNCFFRQWSDGDWQVTADVIKDPKEIYGSPDE